MFRSQTLPGIGNGAKNGILFKGSETFQDLAKVDTILFDKTGTLTVGNPEVAESKTYGDAELALSYLASVEGESDHPLAKAVLSELGDVEVYPVDNTDVVKGGGIVAEVNGSRVAVGNVALMEKEKVQLSAEARKDFEVYEKRGNSLVITAVDGELKALMGIRDQIRPGIKEDLQMMKNFRREELNGTIRR